MLKRIFRPTGDEVTGSWRKLHNEELNDLYSSPSITRMIKSRGMRMAGRVGRMEDKNSYRILVGKPEGNRPLGRPRRRWDDKIRMGLRVIGWSIIRPMQMYTVLTSTVSTNQLLTSHAFREAHIMLGSKFSVLGHLISKVL
jgi:hypothetical protein